MPLEYSIIFYDSDAFKEKVIHLFRSIYPEWTEAECNRMGYKSDKFNHILTLLATKEHQVIGQLNVFRICNECKIANVGYHIHPKWQRQGVGTTLILKALLYLNEAFEDGLVVQTTIENVAAIKLAQKAGFSQAPQSLVEKYKRHFKFLSHEDGVCFHKANQKILKLIE